VNDERLDFVMSLALRFELPPTTLPVWLWIRSPLASLDWALSGERLRAEFNRDEYRRDER
jgi:hypothetical protein